MRVIQPPGAGGPGGPWSDGSEAVACWCANAGVLYAEPFPAPRCVRVAGLGEWRQPPRAALHVPVRLELPPAGGSIDGVSVRLRNRHEGEYYLIPATCGRPVLVEAAGAFARGAQLRTDADGRVREASPGDVAVLRALDGAGPGELVWAVFT